MCATVNQFQCQVRSILMQPMPKADRPGSLVSLRTLWIHLAVVQYQDQFLWRGGIWSS